MNFPSALESELQAIPGAELEKKFVGGIIKTVHKTKNIFVKTWETYLKLVNALHRIFKMSWGQMPPSYSMFIRHWAILMTLQLCWGKGYKKVIIESDCRKSIDIIQDRVLHFGLYNWTREIHWWQSRMEEIKVQWIPREAKCVADKLAKEQHSGSTSFIFHCFVPTFLTSMLHADYVNSSLS